VQSPFAAQRLHDRYLFLQLGSVVTVALVVVVGASVVVVAAGDSVVDTVGQL